MLVNRILGLVIRRIHLNCARDSHVFWQLSCVFKKSKKRENNLCRFILLSWKVLVLLARGVTTTWHWYFYLYLQDPQSLFSLVPISSGWFNAERFPARGQETFSSYRASACPSILRWLTRFHNRPLSRQLTANISLPRRRSANRNTKISTSRDWWTTYSPLSCWLSRGGDSLRSGHPELILHLHTRYYRINSCVSSKKNGDESYYG